MLLPVTCFLGEEQALSWLGEEQVVILTLLTKMYSFAALVFLTCTHHCMYWRLCWVIVAACSLSLVAESGGHSLVVVDGLLIAGASLVAEHSL